MLHEIHLLKPDTLRAGDRHFPCRIGREGIAPLGAKREGDLKTPSGRFYLRQCFYRPDRLAAPQTGLPLAALTPQDGWCDDPAHPRYNHHVTLPFAARHEQLWREDAVYDIIIPLGYNDGGEGEPIIPGHGSAIFMHIMREDGIGTEGCIALTKQDMLALLKELTPNTVIVI